ncbi:hypothetical protein [Flavobacterium orientale]|nr:hypothetical protein [Flavobacterium orientale]
MRLVLKTFFLLISLQLLGQTDTTNVSFVAYWSIGDSYDFKISKVKKQWKEGKLVKDENQSYIANFTVIDSTENSYTINWSYENDFKNTYNIPDQLLDKLSKYRLTEIQYKTSEVGDFIEILNWKEVSEIMNKMFVDIINVKSLDDPKSKDNLEKAMEPFKQIYSSKEGIEQLVMKEIHYFHFPMGLEFDTTETLTYEDQIPNMFGGDPIKANAKMYFEEIDFEENFCIIKHTMELDPDDTLNMLNQVFKSMNLKDGEFEKAFETAVFKINDSNTFEYYFYPGIPHKIETLRETELTINGEKGKRSDKITIELLYQD